MYSDARLTESAAVHAIGPVLLSLREHTESVHNRAVYLGGSTMKRSIPPEATVGMTDIPSSLKSSEKQAVRKLELFQSERRWNP